MRKHLLDTAEEGACAEAVVQICKDVWPDQVSCLVRLQECLEWQHVDTSRKPLPCTHAHKTVSNLLSNAERVAHLPKQIASIPHLISSSLAS